MHPITSERTIFLEGPTNKKVMIRRRDVRLWSGNRYYLQFTEGGLYHCSFYLEESEFLKIYNELNDMKNKEK